jgi:hypothetical protein
MAVSGRIELGRSSRGSEMSKGWHYGFIALFFCLVVYHAGSLNRETARFEDSAAYVVLTEALAGGMGYTDISYAGDPPHAHYPPLFPLLLTPVVYFYGRSFLLIKALVLVFSFNTLLLN